MSQLNGLCILNTRPKDQAQSLSNSIIEAGGTTVEFPVLEIKATNSRWINALPDLNNVNHAIFISANAVNYCFNQLKQHHIIWPATIRVIAIGQASAKALDQWNIPVHDIPKEPDSEHLLALDSLQELKNQIVLLFKGVGGRPVIEEGLLSKEARLYSLEVYKRVMPKIDTQFLHSLWRDNLVDIILVTSEQSIHNLFKMFGKEAHFWLQNKPCLVISKRLAQIATALGIKEIIISHPNRIMNTLFDRVQKYED